MEEKNHYVYKWYNTETKEVFYVGMGKDNRWTEICRNDLFNNYIKKHKCAVKKIIENLTEEEALKMEEMLTDEYKEIGWCKCNINSGKKHSNETKENIRKTIEQILSDKQNANESREKKPIIQIKKDDYNFIASYSSINEAFEKTNINKANIRSCCKGRLNQTKGFFWFYESDYKFLLIYLNMLSKKLVLTQ